MTRGTGLPEVARGTPRARREAPADAAARSAPGEGAAAAEIVRLTNRTAALTLAAAFASIAALVAVGRALSGGTTALARLAAVVFAAAAAFTLIAVWRSRVTLRAARGRAGADPGGGHPV